MSNTLRVIGGLLWTLCAQAQPAITEPGRAKEVLQIFAQRCISCHNAKKPSGNLQLESMEGVAGGGSSGAAIVAGNSSQSNLYKRIATANAVLRMPPAGAPLSSNEVALVKAWIESGAEGLPKAPEVQTGASDFRRDVEPILKNSCYGCHSGCSSPKSLLRLDVKTAVLKGGIGGPAIMPGDSNRSRLIHRIEGTGGEPRMPLGAPAARPRTDRCLASLDRHRRFVA